MSPGTFSGRLTRHPDLVDRISLRRLRLKTFFAGADDPLSFTTKLSRAHGNTVEFGPFLALLFLSVTSRHRRRPGFPVVLAALWAGVFVLSFSAAKLLGQGGAVAARALVA